MHDEKIVSDFKNHDMSALQYVYQTYRKDFIKWASFKYTIEAEVAEDVFSDAVIDVYHNVLAERYHKTEKASLKSYLFEIGKNKILNILNRQKISDTHLKIIANQQDKTYNNIFETNKNQEITSKVKELMDLIDEKCQKVLTLFYYHSLSMDDIAAEMNFKNEDVAKNKKLKCLRKLQQLAFNRYDKTDFFE
jgi:RNA polymerase sigma factor (sigma-70 family)